LLLLAGATFLLASDDPEGALARLRGESITVEPSVSEVGDGPVGQEEKIRIRLTNRTDRPIRVVGGTTTCSCIATQDLPIVLARGETRGIDVFVKFTGSPGRFLRRFVLFTDDETQPVTVARFSGRVTLPSE
jgi:hypothetical protein